MYTQPTQVSDLCYDLLPMQYTELKHKLRKFVLYRFLDFTFGKTTAIGSGRSLESSSVRFSTLIPYSVNSPPRNLDR